MTDLVYTPLEKLEVQRPVHRIHWILEQVRRKNVLDLGAYDETALIKMNTDFWLHGKLAEVAHLVIGVDNSKEIHSEGLKTGDNSFIFQGDICDLGKFANQYEIDVIVGGELIEHLHQPLDFLSSLKNTKKFSGRQLILTTPNATSVHNILLGLFNRESTHKDHLQIYSFKTLNTLFKSAGFSQWTIRPYYASYGEMILKSKGLVKAGVIASEKITNSFEFLFPLLSGGWIGSIII